MESKNKLPSVNAWKEVSGYIFYDMIGKGRFGEVFFAKKENSEKEFAIKSQTKEKIKADEQYLSALKQEIDILKKTKHQNLVGMHNFLVSKNHYHIVMDFCNQGDLKQNLIKRANGKFEEITAVEYMKQIKNAFSELRKMKIIHCDFKLENIFLHDGQIKVGDFGISLINKTEIDYGHGSIFIRAPEMLFPNSFQGTRSKTDLWSIGCVFYHMLLGKHPFPIDNSKEFYDSIIDEKFNPVFDCWISELSTDLLTRLLKKQPSERIDWIDFFEHPLFE